MNLKEKLLSLDVVLDNEYLDKYVKLIESNKDTKKEKFKTQQHHIIPRCYYKHLHMDCDESKHNKVNLLYKDHVLAHCYLSLCAKETWFEYNNLVSIYKIFGAIEKWQNLDERNIIENMDEVQLAYECGRKSLYEFNPMFDIKSREKHDAIMRSDEVKQKISITMKDKASRGELFSDEHRLHLKESRQRRIENGNIGGVFGLKMMYDTLGKRKYVNPSDVDYYLNLGWSLPVNKRRNKGGKAPQGQLTTYTRRKSQEEVHNNLSKSHLGHKPSNYGKSSSEETKTKLRNYFTGTRWMNNGVIQKQIKPEHIEEYLKNGFKYGKLKK